MCPARGEPDHQVAIARVVTGDAIVMRGGTYRTGGLQLVRHHHQPYLDEQPVLKGAGRDRMEALRDGVWRTKWATVPAQLLAWRRGEACAAAPVQQRHGVDGKLLQSRAGKAGWATPGTTSTTNGHVTSVSTHRAGRSRSPHDIAPSPVARRAWQGSTQGPTIRGIVFTQYAFRAIDIGAKPRLGPNEEPTDDPVGVSPAPTARGGRRRST